MIDAGAILRRSNRAISAPLADGHAIVDLLSSEQFVLRGVAAAIWELLEGPISVSALCASLGDRFAVTPDQCRQDVFTFLEHAEAKGLIQQVPR